ncbi:MAG: spore germination protein [Clostridiales bacterium]|nr:spore germination protein [Clostridiales bacterium]
MEAATGLKEVSTDLNTNIEFLTGAFEGCGDFVSRKIVLDEKAPIFICYIDMLTDVDRIRESILRWVMQGPIQNGNKAGQGLFDSLLSNDMVTADLSESNKFDKITGSILSGDTVLFIDSCDKAIIVSTKGFPNRGVPKAETEVSVQGSKEAFSEVYRFNTALIRRRVRDTNLKLIQKRVGRRSATDIGIMYLDDLVRKDILNEVLKRLDGIDIDAVLDAGYIEEFIEGDWASPFPQVQITERPDKAASAIFEGRIVILVDNSPHALIVPVTLNSFFQAAEDYYQRWMIMSFTRVIRFIAGFFAVALPGLYLAAAVYHPSMIPAMLTYKFAAARQDVPFPAFIEVLGMDLAFEFLREAGIRLPGPVGNTMGIVGGLIIGQAAVEAGLVSPIVVICIAITGIASFVVPNYSFVSGFRIIKYLIMVLSAMLGLYGFWLGFLLVLIHLVSLKSFGIPYMYPFTGGDVTGYSDYKDTIFRLPRFMVRERPIFTKPGQRTRIKLNPKKRKGRG